MAYKSLPASIGRDCTLVLIGPYGRVDLPLVTGFSSNQEVKTVRVDPLNGPPVEGHLPAGHKGEFMMDRSGSAADDLCARMESDYWGGRGLGFSTIYQYVQEPDGSTSTYQYDQVAMHLADAGSYKSDATVAQKISFFASTKKRI